MSLSLLTLTLTLTLTYLLQTTADLFRKVSAVLVETARGKRMPELYWEMPNGKLASGDDITVIVVPVKRACRNVL